MYFEPEKDYYTIMEVDSTVTFKELKKKYKKLLKKYNLKRYPDDEEIQQKNNEINEAFLVLSRDLDPDFQEDDEIPNFGWDISSYGTEYSDPDPYKKSHAKYGFIEPFKYYVPSIGISQMVYMPNNVNLDGEKYLLVSSLRAGSIYVIKINDKFDKILDEDKIYFPQRRIRDIQYDQENNVLFLLFEFTPFG